MVGLGIELDAVDHWEALLVGCEAEVTRACERVYEVVVRKGSHAEEHFAEVDWFFCRVDSVLGGARS